MDSLVRLSLLHPNLPSHVCSRKIIQSVTEDALSREHAEVPIPLRHYSELRSLVFSICTFSLSGTLFSQATSTVAMLSKWDDNLETALRFIMYLF